MIAARSDLACEPHRLPYAAIPMDGGEWECRISRDYVYQVKINGAWYFADEVLTSQMLHALQQAFEAMQ